MKRTAIHQEGNASANGNNKKRKTVKKAPAQVAGEQGKAEPDYLNIGMLPNELLSNILLQHLDPFWHIVCKRVCWQWCLLLRDCTYYFPPIHFTAAVAREGHLEVLQWAGSQGYPWNEWICCS